MTRCMVRKKAAFLLVGAIFLMGWERPAAAGSREAGDGPFPSETPADSEPSLEAEKKIVKASEIMDALKTEGGELDCRNCIIEGRIDFSKIPVEPVSDADPGKMVVVIKRALNFRGAQFKGPIFAENPVKFLYPVRFTGARFGGHVTLIGAIFEQGAYFGDAQFTKMSCFNDATFKRHAGFRGAQFDERALFQNAVFEGQADFAIAKFNWLAFFVETKFRYPESMGANFLFTRFKGDTIFSKAEFDGIARFIGTSFLGPAHFSECIFRKNAWFAGGTHFDNNVTFKGSQFLMAPAAGNKKEPSLPPVLFSGVIFSWDAVFSKVRFGRVAFSEMPGPTAIGRDTVFRKRADFREAAFETLDLRRVIFESDADFSRADLGKEVELTDVDIEQANLRLNWKQFLGSDGRPKLRWKGGHGYEASNLPDDNGQGFNSFIRFLTFLERNFRRHEKLADAGRVHYFMEDLKRRKSTGMTWLLDSIFYKGIFGYGVKPWHQVCAAVLFIALFGLAYTRRGVLLFMPAEERKFRLRITDIPVSWSDGKESPGIEGGDAGSYMRRYRQGLSFSFYVFTKMGYGGVYVAGRLKYVVLAEWVIGMAVVVSFLINLSNTLPVLQRLASGLF